MSDKEKVGQQFDERAAVALAALDAAEKKLEEAKRIDTAVDAKLEALAKADLLIKRFEERQQKDPKDVYCPVRDGKLVPVYYNAMVYDEARKGERGVSLVAWVEQDHPCVLPQQEAIKYDKYTRLGKFRPLKAGDKVGQFDVVLAAKDIPTRGGDIKDDFSETPRVATIKKVKIVDGVAVEVEVPLG